MVKDKKIKIEEKLNPLLEPNDEGYVACMNHADRLLDGEIPGNDELIGRRE